MDCDASASAGGSVQALGRWRLRKRRRSVHRHLRMHTMGIFDIDDDID
jgi:hypothetical protein